MTDKLCQNEYIRRIHNVQDYIEGHIGKAMTIEELADTAGFSKFHFSRIFQGMMHEPLAHYVMRIRMEQALFYLAHRLDMNMTDIALELGFTDSAVFSRAFRNFYGLSPSEYRKEYSKNCKEVILLSEYNKDTANKEGAKIVLPVTGQITMTILNDKKVVYVRHTGTYETLAEDYVSLMQSLISLAAKQQIVINEKTWVLAIYHDNPEFGDETQFRTSLCLTVPDGCMAVEDGILGVMDLSGGLYAVGHFEIQADEFGGAWDYMYQTWLTQSGYVPRNSYPFEVYQNNPNEDPNHQVIVDIYVPVEPITY